MHTIIAYHTATRASALADYGLDRKNMTGFSIRTKTKADKAWSVDLLTAHWGSPQVVSRGRVHVADALPGLIAEFEAQRVGLLTYQLDGDGCEVVSLNSLLEKRGVATALLEAVTEVAAQAGCRRVWLVTTNDNLPALRFYQKRGFRLSALHPDAMRKSRELKPEIPERGLADIPIRDEIELEKRL